MAITKTTQYTKIDMRSNREIRIYITDTWDDPDDDDMPISKERVLTLLPNPNDISELPSGLQNVVNAAIEANFFTG
tara:strand:+ start:1866 stop:2093 length:228 start_codon:yes stop_codon:yes gene_type:complete